MKFTNENKNQVLHWCNSHQMNVWANFEDGEPVIMIPKLDGSEQVCRLGNTIKLMDKPNGWEKLEVLI